MKKKKLFILAICLSLLNCIALQAANISGNAIALDGINDYVRIPDAPQLGGMSSLTIETWFMPYDTMRDNPIFNKSDWGNVMTDRSYELGLAPHTPGWAVFTGSSGWTWLYGSTPPPVTVGQWTHIAATYDSVAGVASLYFNGELFLTTTTDAGGSPISGLIRDSSEDLILGAVLANAYVNAYGPGFSFGLMDEVRLWNVARSDAEIKEWYNKIVSPIANGLIGYWNFDENIENPSVLDLSSYHNNGILMGATRITSTVPIVPEPCTLSLLALGAILAVRKRRK